MLLKHVFLLASQHWLTPITQTLGRSLCTAGLGVMVGCLGFAPALVAPAIAEEDLIMRIGIVEEASRIRLGTSTPGEVLVGDGTVVGRTTAMRPSYSTLSNGQIQVGDIRGTHLIIRPQDPNGLVFIGDNWYRGTVELILDGSGMTAINYVELTDYIASVIGSEMGDRFALEALKAQAVASRTYALFHRSQRLNDELFDLGDSQTWQVYKGMGAESELTRRAALATEGHVLTYDRQLINSVFHASSGGQTEDVEDVWSRALPYLRGTNDSQVSPPMHWQEDVTPTELEEAFGDVGDVLDLEIVAATPHGRVEALRLEGTEGVEEIDGAEMRRSFGLDSTWFTIIAIGPTLGASNRSADATPTHFTLSGRGYGHGVGMSQWGANGLASQGWSYSQILGYYYQNSTLSIIDVQ